MSLRDFAVPTEIQTAFRAAKITILQARDLEMSFASFVEKFRFFIWGVWRNHVVLLLGLRISTDLLKVLKFSILFVFQTRMIPQIVVC